MTLRIPTNLSLPKDLVDELDAICGPRNRSAFVEVAVRHLLKREQLRTAWQRAAGSWKDADYPEFATPEAVAAWVHESRRQVTDPGREV